ncbi:putative late blight resistance protein homolog R1A-3 [Coffea arabica]|uniref:Late blight resistance protein homolog R1A-3 n=1 Tax=Coffea arabica TaxID=13443 RepID=A0A6P6T6N1_COFAR|nr:putative late blight resistance protein homolog R1A-3 [Coffea arabica]XP_027073838.1 putative late blight resistance protein homolog R1A-3 [Coffea arabica]XP_027073840.1 putative late blight resistance protein homolog R1A-3 [Coffea arabica]
MEFRQLVSALSNEWFFDMDIEELHRILNRYALVLPLPDIGDNSTYSIVKGLRDYVKLRARLDQDISYLTEDLLQKLMFSKNLLHIATMQGVDRMQLIDLLTHYTLLAVNAECLRKIYWSVYIDGMVFNNTQIRISKLQRKLELVDPQFHATSARIMKTLLKATKVLSRSPLTYAMNALLKASKVISRSPPTFVMNALQKASKVPSRSPLNFSLEMNKYIVEEFVDSLLAALRQILERHATFTVPVRDHMLKLYEGVKSISILLHVKQENLYALPDKMKDHIGVVIIDLGIVICSFSVNEIKHGLAEGTNRAISHLVKELQIVIQEVAQTHPPPSSSLSFPRTNELGSLDFFLENLRELATSEAGSIAFPVDQIQGIQEDIIFLRSLLRKIVKQRNQHGKIQALWDRAMEVAYKAELIIDSIALGDRLECLDTVAGDIKHMKIEALKITDSIKNDDEVQRIASNSIHFKSQFITPTLNEVLVGLDEAVKTITDKLTRGSKQLDIVSIVGMAGLGKTTLANAVYHHSSILGHFHIRAWCTVSQVYCKHNLLVQILSSIGGRSPDQCLEEDEDDLAEELKKILLRNIYLIVMDDVWDIDAWNLLKTSLPDNANGSRILFTSRLQNLSWQFKPNSEPYHLRQLTDVECFELLHRKIFGKGDCPPAIIKVLMQVANKCKGLPHTVLIFAGILSRIEPDCWQEFVNSLSSGTSNNTGPLELSYIHLPENLKPCLLYFGTFREDQDIPIRRLSWLWISEGFIQKTEGKSLEDVAEGFLKDLIGRSLVMVTKQSSLAGAKTCRLHDLVHEFCVAKAKEESFLQILPGGNDFSTFTGPCPHRLCVYLTKSQELKKSRVVFPELRSLLFFRSASWSLKEPREGSDLFPKSKLLRVLDFGDIYFDGNFPMELLLLVHLRYLAVNLFKIVSIPSAIDNLSRLQTFLVKGDCHHVALPNTIWNVKTLRHLEITGYLQLGFILPTVDVEDSPDLDHLDTFSLAIDSYGGRLQNKLQKLPSIRKLKCVNTLCLGNRSQILKLDSLSRLETLKLHLFGGCKFEFPTNLKKLTLSGNECPSSEISRIGKLPNLEVLKLSYRSFEEAKWEMHDGEFSNLRFLKLSIASLRSWTAYNSDNFSRLEKLVLFKCWRLEEVPLCLGESPAIEMIEVQFCPFIISSVRQIQQVQMDMGNQDLKIVI